MAIAGAGGNPRGGLDRPINCVAKREYEKMRRRIGRFLADPVGCDRSGC